MKTVRGQGRVWRFGRARLGAREHQPVAREARAARALDGEGRLPDAIDQARAAGIEPVAARQRTARPGRAHQSEIVVHQRVAVLAVAAERSESREIAARADAHFEALAAQQVEHHGILGDPHRQFERQGHDPRAETDARGRRRGVGQEDEGRRQAALGLVEMMLRDPGGIESDLLGLDDLRRGQPIALGGIGLIEETREEPQAFDRRLHCHAPNLARSGVSRKRRGGSPP
jgi:hypothetical protein